MTKLDEGSSGGDPMWATRLSAAGWIYGIAEDGEVDDDFLREIPLFSVTTMRLIRQLHVGPDQFCKVQR